MACEFKRAGFLEGDAIGISLPIGLALTLELGRWLFTHARLMLAVVDNNSVGDCNGLVEIHSRWFSQLGSGFACSALQKNRPV